MKRPTEKPRHGNLLLSAVIIAASAFVTLLLFYPSASPLGPAFSVEAIILLVRQASWVLGAALMGGRLIGMVKRGNLLYSVTGMLNLLLGVFSLLLYILSMAAPAWAHLFFLNLVVGLLFCADILS